MCDLECKRLNAIEKSQFQKIVTLFKKYKYGTKILEHLKLHGYQDDVNGKIAYYMVLKKDMPVFYFALCCGQLFKPKDTCSESTINQYNRIRQDLQNDEIETDDDDIPKTITDAERKLLLSQDIDLATLTPDEAIEKIEDLVKYPANAEITSHNCKLPVQNSFSSIEIAYICTNDDINQIWSNLKTSKKIGETMFWIYVVPQIFKIKELIGLEKIYLFVADESETLSLNSYYQEYLHFKPLDSYTVCQADFTKDCSVMYQSVEELFENQQIFFETFADEIPNGDAE